MAKRHVRCLTTSILLALVSAPAAWAQVGTLFVEGDKVGIGTDTPSVALEVKGTDSTATRVQVTNTNESAAFRTLFELRNNGSPRFVLRDTSTGDAWQMLSTGLNGSFIFGKMGTGVNEFVVFPNGDVTISGEMTAVDYNTSSSRTVKRDIEPVNSRAVLEKLLELPVSIWRFAKHEQGSIHIGPMAEDFSSLFGLGDDDMHISLIDAAGVAFASIQGLNQIIEEKSQELERLQKKNSELEQRLMRLEEALLELGAVAERGE